MAAFSQSTNSSFPFLLFLNTKRKICAVSPSVFLSIYLFCLSVYLSILSVSCSWILNERFLQFLYLSFCLSVYLSILSISCSWILNKRFVQFLYLSFCLSVFLSFCLSVFLSFCLSVYSVRLLFLNAKRKWQMCEPPR